MTPSEVQGKTQEKVENLPKNSETRGNFPCRTDRKDIDYIKYYSWQEFQYEKHQN